MTTATASATHRLHEIGRTECVSEGCEPQMFDGYTQPPYLARRTPTVIGLSTITRLEFGWRLER
jgi:hypothetical protein